MTNSSDLNASRINLVDGLRGVSILLVVLFHYSSVYTTKYSISVNSIYELSWGGVGVNIFFVISGFVISKSLMTSSVRSFAISRLSRIYPTYVCSVLFTSIVLLYFGSWYSAPTTDQVIANLTFFQIYLGYPNIDGVYWSLRVEILFYLTVGFMFFLKNKSFWKLIFCYVVVACLANTFEIYLEENIIFSALSSLLNFHYIQFFVVGMVCYGLLYEPRFSDEAYYAWLSLLICLLDLLLNKSSPAITAAIFAMLVLLCTKSAPNVLRWLLDNSLIVFFGKISYSWYLQHQVIGYLIIRFLEGVGFSLSVALAIAVLLTVSIAVVSQKILEERLSKRVKKLFLRSTI